MSHLASHPPAHRVNNSSNLRLLSHGQPHAGPPRRIQRNRMVGHYRISILQVVLHGIAQRQEPLFLS